MTVLRIDLETYSSVDLKKCGVHKYVESDDFQIMLFGFKYGSGQVHVVDLMVGEKIPPHILEAIDDPTIQKTAPIYPESTTLMQLVEIFMRLI